MTRVATGAVVLLAMATAIANSAEIPADLVTAPAAVLCKTPFQLEEAAKAVGDEAWLKQIACLRSPAGVPALRIDPSPVPDLYQPWQVRLQVPGAAGITLWGYHWSFTAKNGTTMIEIYRTRTAPRR